MVSPLEVVIIPQTPVILGNEVGPIYPILAAKLVSGGQCKNLSIQQLAVSTQPALVDWSPLHDNKFWGGLKTMRDFREIKVWAKAHLLTLEIYKATSLFPREEMYGLTSQLRRASASIAANIAEGFGRGGNTELARFLQIAMGSASEVEYHVLLAKDLNLLTNKIYNDLEARIVEVKRMLASLSVKVRRDRFNR